MALSKRDTFQLAFNILSAFKESGNLYDEYKEDEKFTDDQYDDMLDLLRVEISKN